ncbi:MAG TPA: amidase [Bryobacteraceae bacterium]|jgi:aspartyl-tRNA(Asn)/glutamyl-tRNA(Gln) amidotransferase subunit A|nr:amidase [Bryobacteraceae bacterium]
MAELGSETFFAGIAELNRMLRAKEATALDLARAFGRRLETLGPRYNALALPLTERAIRQAKAVDAEIKRGRLRGPLQGVPYGAKDLLSVAGQITTWGARPCASQVFDYDAAVIQKLESAGAPLVGKLAMVELAGGPGYRYAAASLTGPGRNPWDRSRWSGGSSSGSAIAVAAGLVPFAIGSETSGSILTPAAFCGVTALRPTYGLVSRYGAMPLSWTLDKLGPFCHSAEDCGLVLETIAGGDHRDPGSAGKSFYYTPQYARKMSELRIGFAPADFSEWPDDAARPALQQALETMRSLGATMVETRLPDFPYGPIISAIISVDAASVFEPLIASGKVDELADQKQIAGLKAGLEIPASIYLKAMRVRRLAQEAMHKLLGDVDVLLTPGRLGPAPKIDEPLDVRPDRPRPKDAGLTPLIPAGNLAGMPALSLPCGFAGNLPVALQLAGAPLTENTLLAVGKEFQSRSDWHKRRPPGVG